MTTLPIHAILPDLKSTLRASPHAVLQAAPGAGKTTVVPIALMDEPWLDGKKIVMLEPRRLAARAAAQRMARTLGEKVGERVGYRMRGEVNVSEKTRIEVVTEGILTRMLQNDPALEGVGLVIFDEFHERSIHADLGLALSLQTQEMFRDELRILVMSATLQKTSIATVLNDAPILESEGRSFPISLRHLDIRTPRPHPSRIAEAAARQTLHALRSEEGSVLVFLPGAAEIFKAKRLLETAIGEEIVVAPLFGAMDSQAQRAAIEPAPEGKRKVVLATNIAETSLTIEGVRVVVDSGLERSVRYDAASGMQRYETRLISRESATQRAGRAGRTEPGVCYRLWHETHALAPTRKPEILTGDLSQLRLELAAWGASANELKWIDAPPEYALKEAENLLILLNMMSTDNQITPHGKKALTLGQPPRIAHMLLEAKKLSLGYEAALLALYWQEHPFRSENGDLGDIMRRCADVCRRDSRFQTSLKRLLRTMETAPKNEPDTDAAALLTALAFPERIAMQRGRPGLYRCASGKGAALTKKSALHHSKFLAIARMGGEGAEGRIYEAAPLDEKTLHAHFSHLIEKKEVVGWNGEKGRIEALETECFGALVLKSRPLENPDERLITKGLLEAVRAKGLQTLPWTPKSRTLLARLRFAHRHLPETFCDMSDMALLEHLQTWLGPFLSGMKSFKDLQRLDMAKILRAHAGWENMQTLDDIAPERIEVPSGSDIAVDYSDPAKAVLPVRLQEVFGWRETPRILHGKVPLTLHLLSPAHRPLQITEDLLHFWKSVYPEVRKEMRGRYPKHYWPEDPLSAVATNRTKKGMAKAKTGHR
ncbi:ATP-dependent helicase HrpB [Hydrogenimonas urashimensis]|uniref:ATP-dependent helicase HrpB n=1 Tax=Hydrogenimonas urashimensis TaxID=2740515 RepID=UPI00191541B0|nr:ATP-dependent helicase HrpB [Hydrogenimonas urashimensis]